MFKTLQQPFPRPERSTIQKVLNSLFEGIGVTLFFVIFQPFGISGWQVENKLLYLAVYGGIVFTVTFLYRVVFPLAFPKYFYELNWTVAREIIGILCILVAITTCILLYHHLIFEHSNSQLKNSLFIFFLVVVIGSVPITISVLSRFAYLYKKYNREIKVTSNVPQNLYLKLVADNERDMLEIDNLLYIESADNYCSVVFLQDDKPKKELLRSSLSRLEAQINDNRIIRCHRSYIVNLNLVSAVTGNAQGYKLHLEKAREIIPVARKYSHIVDSIRP